MVRFARDEPRPRGEPARPSARSEASRLRGGACGRRRDRWHTASRRRAPCPPPRASLPPMPYGSSAATSPDRPPADSSPPLCRSVNSPVCRCTRGLARGRRPRARSARRVRGRRAPSAEPSRTASSLAARPGDHAARAHRRRRRVPRCQRHAAPRRGTSPGWSSAGRRVSCHYRSMMRTPRVLPRPWASMSQTALDDVGQLESAACLWRQAYQGRPQHAPLLLADQVLWCCADAERREPWPRAARRPWRSLAMLPGELCLKDAAQPKSYF